MSPTPPAVASPLRLALSAPAVIALLLLQIQRLLTPGPLLSFVLLEAACLAVAWSVARRRPEMSWAFVPAMWIGIALGALADAFWLGGRIATVPALLGSAAPALAAGFAIARAWPHGAQGQ